MNAIIGRTIPAKIYKYRPLQNDMQRGWLRGIVLNSEWYFSTPDQFNDPYDCAPMYRGLHGRELETHLTQLIQRVYPNLNRAERRAKACELRATPLDVVAARLDEVREIMRETAIYSLCEDPLSLLMWSHYAHSHRGTCLQFDMGDLHESFTPQGVLGLPVIYCAERPEIVIGAHDSKKLIQDVFLRKADCWSYEREWRFLAYRRGAANIQFPSAALRSIILGANIRPGEEEFVRSLVSQSVHPISIERAIFNESEFALHLSA